MLTLERMGKSRLLAVWCTISLYCERTSIGLFMVALGSLALLWGIPHTAEAAFRLGSSSLIFGGAIFIVSKLRPREEKKEVKEMRREPTRTKQEDGGSKEMNKNDQIMWDWAKRQDQYRVDQFGIGIVGIGALFFAYGQVSGSALKLLIAFIAMGGSFALWIHMWGATKEYRKISEQLRCRYPEFFRRFYEATLFWKKESHFYHPVTRLMTYFMALVTWAWLAIVAYRLSILNTHPLPDSSTFQILLYVSILLVSTVALLAFSRKYHTDPEHDKRALKELSPSATARNWTRTSDLSMTIRGRSWGLRSLMLEET